jgi:hypothetical protein
MRKLKSWQTILLAGAGVILPILSCSQRSLVLVDVQAPQGVAYTDVTVTIAAGTEQSTTFDKVTFDAAGTFKAGIYLPSDMTGQVTLKADVIETNCTVGTGTIQTPPISDGETTPTLNLPITSSADPCVSGTGGSAGASGTGGAGGLGGQTGAAGAGGMVGAGGAAGSAGHSGGTGAAGAGGIVGTGGVVGSGGATGNAGAPGMGGKGGATGTGGGNATGGHGGMGAGGMVGAGGMPGAGGSSTTGTGGVMGAGGSTGGGGGGGKGGGGTGGAVGSGGATGSGGVGTGGGGGCNCPTNFICMAGSTTCVCSEPDTQTCSGVICGTVTNTCGQSVTCPDNCPSGEVCVASTNSCRTLTSTGCGGDVVATGTGLVVGTDEAGPPIVCQ